MIFKIGDKGPDISKIQKFLSGLGYNIGVIDGIFGKKLKLAVIEYQSKKSLMPDGIIGDKTISEMKKDGFIYSTEVKESFDIKSATDKITGNFKVKVISLRGGKDTDHDGNNFGRYDDIVYLVSPDGIESFRANTDPSAIGWNPGVGKPYAQLVPGLWYFIKGPHKNKGKSFRQVNPEEGSEVSLLQKVGLTAKNALFTVLRVFGKNNPKNYKETGYFAINIHLGGSNGTSSWGCQTFPPDEWTEFRDKTYELMSKYNQQVLPYLLIDNT